MNRDGLTSRQRLAHRCNRARMAAAEQAQAFLYSDVLRMSGRDRERWASARRWADLGECVAAWLRGEIVQTPGHGGPPCDETIPHIPVLAAVNRAGFVTDNSQSADGPWEAWASGFLPHTLLPRLQSVISGTPLILEQWCQGRQHHGCKFPKFLFCPQAESAGFWAEHCPQVADELHAAWYVTVADPEPGRNDRLWPALAEFAGLVRSS